MCNVHEKHTMCHSSNLFANEYCPNDSKYERVFIIRPNPLTPSTWDPKHPPRIQDLQYELPHNKIGEYCNVHGPNRRIKHIKLPFIFDRNKLSDEDKFLNNEEEGNNNSVSLPHLNDDYYSPPPFIYQE